MKAEAIAIALLVFLVTHLAAAGAGWYWAKTRYELRESVKATEAFAADQKRVQRADVVALAHAEWKQKQATVTAAEESKIEKAIELDPDWAGTAIPAGVRAALAAAALSITTTEYVDAQLPSPDGARPGDKPRSSARLGGVTQGLEGMLRAAPAPE